MKNNTRLKFSKMCGDMAATYGVPSVEKSFAATPSIEQTLMDKIVASSGFLQRINVLGVDDLKGEKILGSVTGLLGKRTDTNAGDRQTSDMVSLDAIAYECIKTEYDVHMKYATVDAWAKFPDFNDRFMNYVRTAIAQARIKAGFHGTSAAAVTDGGTNVNGEDVNKGWFQHLREYNSGAQMFDQGTTLNQIRVGGAGDYANLDGLVFDVLQMVGEAHRDGGDLVALMGSELLAYDKTQLYTAQGAVPTEKERLEANAVTRTYGGLPAYSVPFMPARGLLVTSWDNLSLYFQNGAVRQKIDDNAKRDRVEHYNTMNEAYVVEDLEKAAGIEFANVKLWDGAAFA
jgi:P2 family phage major capsid protein